MFEPMTARHCAVCKYICRYLQYDSLLLSIFLVKNFRGFGRPTYSPYQYVAPKNMWSLAPTARWVAAGSRLRAT